MTSAPVDDAHDSLHVLADALVAKCAALVEAEARELPYAPAWADPRPAAARSAASRSRAAA